jgi:hypothetical protein
MKAIWNGVEQYQPKKRGAIHHDSNVVPFLVRHLFLARVGVSVGGSRGRRVNLSLMKESAVDARRGGGQGLSSWLLPLILSRLFSPSLFLLKERCTITGKVALFSIPIEGTLA